MTVTRRRRGARCGSFGSVRPWRQLGATAQDYCEIGNKAPCWSGGALAEKEGPWAGSPPSPQRSLSSPSAWGRRPALRRNSNSATMFGRRRRSRSLIRRRIKAGSRPVGSRSTPATAPNSPRRRIPAQSTAAARPRPIAARRALRRRAWSNSARQFAIWEKANVHGCDAQEQASNSPPASPSTPHAQTSN